jgi:hypothetical protein
MLSLPIPQATKEYRTIIRYYPLSLLKKPLEIHFLLGEYSTISEIRQKIQEQALKAGLIHPDHKELPFIARVKGKSVVEMLEREKFIKTHIEKGDEICTFERILLPEHQTEGHFILELKFAQYRRNYLFMSGQQQICTSRLIIANKAWTVRQLKIEIFKLLQPIIA